MVQDMTPEEREEYERKVKEEEEEMLARVNS